MPELAEVEYYRRRWQQAAAGRKVVRVEAHGGAKVFRGTDPALILRHLPGEALSGSAASGKQMLFRFTGGNWLGVHLGMTGELKVAPPGHRPDRHDHLVLFTRRQALVFSDPRTFGRIRFDRGRGEPDWWTRLAPAILSPAFTVGEVSAFLRRRARAPIKAVLLMQERFPGVGNWMADEILWRVAIHPRQAAGSLRPAEIRALWRECRRVCRSAVALVAGREGRPPPSLRSEFPPSWLFPHRWEDGGTCPRTGSPLARATIGGRTTCWSPARQRIHA